MNAQNDWNFLANRLNFNIKLGSQTLQWRGTGGREPGRIRAEDGREAGGEGSGSASHATAGEE